MNLIAIEIGNTNITVALYVHSTEVLIEKVAGSDRAGAAEVIKNAWQHIPFSRSAKEQIRDGIVLVSSVKPNWTEMIEQIVDETIGEKIKLIPEDVPVPIEVGFDDKDSIGTDRLLSALAAYEVVKDTVIIADFGTATTIDVVNSEGVFLGGVIMPGVELSAEILAQSTALLPKVEIKKPQMPFGQSTVEAINAGIYYSSVSSLQEIIRRYSQQLGRWPQTVVTGSAAALIKDDCDFIDSFVENLPIKGMLLAYNKHLGVQQ